MCIPYVHSFQSCLYLFYVCQEIDQTPPYTKEKRLALQTNEIEPSDAATAATTQALDYSDSEEEWEVETTQAQPDTTQVAAFMQVHTFPIP